MFWGHSNSLAVVRYNPLCLYLNGHVNVRIMVNDQYYKPTDRLIHGTHLYQVIAMGLTFI